MQSKLQEKVKFTNYWWLILSFYGLIHFTIHAINPAMYPIGICLFILGILTYKTKYITKKISFGFAISLILIYGMHDAFSSTATFFAFLVSTSILLWSYWKDYTVNEAYNSLLIIPAICDIFAGLNKLVPGNHFLYNDLLLTVFNENLFIEPSFVLDNINLLKVSVPFIEIIAGLLILINPQKALFFICFLHIPIAISTAKTFGHLAQLLTYASFLIFCVKAANVIRKNNLEEIHNISPLKTFFSNIKLFKSSPLIYISERLSPLLVLGIFQVIVPLGLLIIRIATGEKIFYGFGWQMYS